MYKDTPQMHLTPLKVTVHEINPQVTHILKQLKTSKHDLQHEKEGSATSAGIPE